MDSIKFEVEATPANADSTEWIGHIHIKSSGGISRVVYTTTGSHKSTTKAENTAVTEFAIHLSQMIDT